MARKHQIGPPPDRRLVTIQEASVLLGGISRDMVFLLMRDGRLPRVKIGSRTLISVKSIDDFIRKQEEQAR